MAKLSASAAILLRLAAMGTSTVCPPKWSFDLGTGGNSIVTSRFPMALPNLKDWTPEQQNGGFRVVLDAAIDDGLTKSAIFVGRNQIPVSTWSHYDLGRWNAAVYTTKPDVTDVGRAKHRSRRRHGDETMLIGVHQNGNQVLPYAGPYTFFKNPTNFHRRFSMLWIDSNPATSLSLTAIWNGTEDFDVPEISFGPVEIEFAQEVNLTDIVKSQHVSVSGVERKRDGKHWRIASIELDAMECSKQST